MHSLRSYHPLWSIHCRRSSIGGTPRYQAPEISRLLLFSGSSAVIADEQLYIAQHPTVDVYSYGLLHEILHGRTVFSGMAPLAAMMQAMHGVRPPMSLRPEHACLAELLQACWHADASLRPNMERVVETLTM